MEGRFSMRFQHGLLCRLDRRQAGGAAVDGRNILISLLIINAVSLKLGQGGHRLPVKRIELFR